MEGQYEIYPTPPKRPTVSEQAIRSAEYVLAQYLPQTYVTVPADARLCREHPYTAVARSIYLNDNYVAYRVMRRFFPDVAHAIKKCLYDAYTYHRDPKYSIFLGDVYSPTFPIMGTVTTDVKTVTVDAEVYTVRRVDYAGWIYDFELYADLCALAGIYEVRVGRPKIALRFLKKLKGMWEGKGLADMVFEREGHYSTYKCALAGILAEHLGDWEFAETMITAILKNQDIWDRLKGISSPYNTQGFITDYLPDLKPRTPSVPTNVETTTFCVMAIAPYVLF